MMAKNRKKAEEYVIKALKAIDPSGRSHKHAMVCFEGMSDARFDQWIQELKAGTSHIQIFLENHMDGPRIEMEGALQACEDYGIQIFQRYWYYNPELKMTSLSNDAVPFIHAPIRRQIETNMNKINTSRTNTVLDVYTGQGIDDSAAFTQSESTIYVNRGLDDVLVEKLKYRGGDVEGGRAFDKALIDNGEVSTTELLNKEHTTTRIVQTTDILLTSAHYESNLNPTK